LVLADRDAERSKVARQAPGESGDCCLRARIQAAPFKGHTIGVAAPDVDNSIALRHMAGCGLRSDECAAHIDADYSVEIAERAFAYVFDDDNTGIVDKYIELACQPSDAIDGGFDGRCGGIVGLDCPSPPPKLLDRLQGSRAGIS
jgi:hypothetical protein